MRIASGGGSFIYIRLKPIHFRAKTFDMSIATMYTSTSSVKSIADLNLEQMYLLMLSKYPTTIVVRKMKNFISLFVKNPSFFNCIGLLDVCKSQIKKIYTVYSLK